MGFNRYKNKRAGLTIPEVLLITAILTLVFIGMRYALFRPARRSTGHGVRKTIDNSR